MTDFEVVVNSTDTFSDCWDPFFTLFAAYWPSWDRRVLLNTELVDYTHPGVDVHAARTGARDERGQRPWGECLLRCLEQVRTPYLLYFQEDYFLQAPVLTDKVTEYAALAAERDLVSVRLLETPISGPWRPTDRPDLAEVDRSSDYLVSMMAGLWRTDFLRATLRAHETPWQFEALGTKRLRRAGTRVHSVNRDVYSEVTGQQVIPYEPTGITRGRWMEHIVVDLFTEHGISVDFTERGFYRDDADALRPPQPLLTRAVGRIRSLR